MIADGLTFAEIEAADPTMPRAAQIALWATDKARHSRFVLRYERATVAFQEQQLMAMRAGIRDATGKTKFDAIRFDVERLAKRLDSRGAGAGPSFTDQCPPWLKSTIAGALAQIMRPVVTSALPSGDAADE